MLTVELASLSEDLIEAGIRESVPEGWTFDAYQDADSRLWVAKFHNGTSTEWEISDITLKQVLLHARGWLEVRKIKIPDGSRWAPRVKEVSLDRVHDLAYRVVSDDGPPDLDPGEISSVYSSPRRGGK